LDSTEVARKSLSVLLSGQTGHVVDVRRDGGTAALAHD
jgi:2-C-methyl-D-erythritol 4-phosphate cytidylyltransferase